MLFGRWVGLLMADRRGMTGWQRRRGCAAAAGRGGWAGGSVLGWLRAACECWVPTVAARAVDDGWRSGYGFQLFRLEERSAAKCLSTFGAHLTTNCSFDDIERRKRAVSLCCMCHTSDFPNKIVAQIWSRSVQERIKEMRRFRYEQDSILCRHRSSDAPPLSISEREEDAGPLTALLCTGRGAAAGQLPTPASVALSTPLPGPASARCISARSQLTKHRVEESRAEQPGVEKVRVSRYCFKMDKYINWRM